MMVVVKMIDLLKEKKSNVDLTDFSQFYDSDNDETEENEIEKYLSSKVQKELDLNILEWWKAHQDHYPKLSILCSYYLSIPASSAPSEREFSAAGLTINET